MRKTYSRIKSTLVLTLAATLVASSNTAWTGALDGPPRGDSAVPAVAPERHSAAPSPGAGSTPTGWLEAVERGLAASEYEVTWQQFPVLVDIPPSWQAPNRAQGFRTYFMADGIRILPRDAGNARWRWGLSVSGYGRGGSIGAVEPGEPEASGHKIEYRRRDFEESYENSPMGLEQRFVLEGPPSDNAPHVKLAPLPGRARDVDPQSLLHVDLTLWGDLSPIVSEDGQVIDFVTAQGARAIRYAQLVVTDARGRTLPSWMEATTEGGGRPRPAARGGEGTSEQQAWRGISLFVDARAAAYPITIDPWVRGAVWTAELSAQPSAGFGYCVGTAGDVNGDGYADVIVGAPYYDAGQAEAGRAFVFLGSASGLALTPAWFAEGESFAALLGHSVGTAGDIDGDGYADVLVGAPGDRNVGSVTIYRGSASGPSPQPSWRVDGDQAGAQFGYSVGTAGDVNGDGHPDLIVGAPYYYDGQVMEGRSFLYLGYSSGLASAPAWTAESDQASALFGSSVGTAGDVNGDGYADVIVGAPNYDGAQTDEGRAYVYLGSASGPAQDPSWTVEGDQDSAHFGSSVGTAGDVNGDGYADVIVGAPQYDGGQPDEGQAYLFLGAGTGLSSSPDWTAMGGQAYGNFGASVGAAGDLNGDGYGDVVVGAPTYDNPRAYVYSGSASGLAPVSVWAEGDLGNPLFGDLVASAGDVNGDGYDDLIVGSSGRAYLYLGSASGPAAGPDWTKTGDQAYAYLGISVGTAGDVNGDGYDDVIVGADGYDNGESEEGRAYLYLGSAAGLTLTPGWTAESDQARAHFGNSLGTAGDVNGDGYADVIVGAYQYSGSHRREGRAYVYLGSATGLSQSPAWTMEGGQASAFFGNSVAKAGDVNGDGYDDVLVGAPRYDNGEKNEGRAYLYLGSSQGLSTTPSWTTESNKASASFGYSLGSAGDVNGDGYDDVIVGSPGYSDHAVYLYLGSADGLSNDPAWTVQSNQPFAQFGRSMGKAGDVNGDGYADVIVGAYAYHHGQLGEGRAFVYLGSVAGLSLSPAWTAESDQAGAEFGRSVGTAGDVNGDGYDDIVVGSPSYDGGQTDEGRAYVYFGSASGPALSPSWTAEIDYYSAHYANSVGTAGDVNGDGYDDVIVGASQLSVLMGAQGGAFVYYGNGDGRLNIRPQ